jgi:ubiquinone/menaquinone biosynthesis C-methylase UbiE
LSLAADDARQRNRRLFDGVFGSVYSFYMERERLSRLVGRAVWGSDVRPFYASMGAIGEVGDRGTIVDVPCGAGIALRGLRSGQRVRYRAFDLSPRMLARARETAIKRGLTQVELAEADAESLPVDGGEADLFLSYFGLHCFADPVAAVREAVRCLKPAGRIVGSMIVHGDRRLDKLRVRPGAGGFGPGGSASDLSGWLADAGLEGIDIDRSGVFAVFRARKPGR